MRIDQLIYLQEIASSGSFSRAAEKLNIAQPSLSQAVAALEEELGVQLFKRSRHGAQLTEIGERVFEKSRAVSNLLDEIKIVAGKQQSMLSGKLKIASIPSFFATILPKAAIAFKNRYPHIHLEMIEEGSLEIANHLSNGAIDIGLVSRRSMANFDKNMTFKPLFSGRIMACVNNKSPYAGKKNISVKDIIQWPLVMFNQNYRMHAHLMKMLSKVGKPNIFLTARNSFSIKKVVIDGLAIGFDASISLKTDPYIENGSIIPLNIIEETDTTFGILFKKKYLSLAADEFMTELEGQAENFRRIYNIKIN